MIYVFEEFSTRYFINVAGGNENIPSDNTDAILLETPRCFAMACDASRSTEIAEIDRFHGIVHVTGPELIHAHV